MVNALITTNVVPVEPGIYGEITSGASLTPSAVGIVALVGKASSGDLGLAHVLGSPDAVAQMYGAASALDRSDTTSTLANLAREAEVGGAIEYVCVRVGAGGTKASRTLSDGLAASIGHLDCPSPGVGGNALTFSIRPLAGDATQKELVVYLGTTVVQNNRFPATSGDEAAGLAAATVGQQFAVFTNTGIGNGVLATVTAAHLDTTAGADPTVVNGDYTTAFGYLSSLPWATLVTDSENPSIHSAVSAFINAETAAGRFRTAAVGEPTSVAEATRRTDSSALNDCLIRYAGNGYKFPNPDGTSRSVEGYLAAAQQAGVLSTLLPGESMTWRNVPGATDIVGAVVDKAGAQLAGMGYFESSAHGFRTGAGVSTLVNSGNAPVWAVELNDGWKKFEHVATAFGLLSEIGDAWDQEVANPDVTQRPPNSPAGRAALVAIANRSTAKYVDNGWLISGAVIVDPANPPTPDTAYFTFTDLIVALRAERLVLKLPFGQA